MLAESAMGWAWRAVLGEQARKYEVRVVLPPPPAP